MVTLLGSWELVAFLFLWSVACVLSVMVRLLFLFVLLLSVIVAVPGHLLYYYSWLSLSRPRLSRITAYLEEKIWSLSKHENLTTGKNILWKRGEIAPKDLFHNIFNISLTLRAQLHVYLLNVIVRIIFSSILQIWYAEVRIPRSISRESLGIRDNESRLYYFLEKM